MVGCSPLQIGQDLGEIVRWRVSNVDSAYVYAILESHEGIASYSTLEYKIGEPSRVLEIWIPGSRRVEARRVLDEIIAECGSNICELTSEIKE